MPAITSCRFYVPCSGSSSGTNRLLLRVAPAEETLVYDPTDFNPRPIIAAGLTFCLPRCATFMLCLAFSAPFLYIIFFSRFTPCLIITSTPSYRRGSPAPASPAPTPWICMHVDSLKSDDTCVGRYVLQPTEQPRCARRTADRAWTAGGRSAGTAPALESCAAACGGHRQGVYISLS